MSDEPSAKPVGERLRRLPSTIRPRERLSIWGVRLVFGALLLTLSELVMWQNPMQRPWYDWPVLLVLYTALGAAMLDVVVRFQVYTPAALGLVSGLYGLISSCIITPTALENVPIGLLVHGLGLQTAAGFFGLMIFVIVMRGHQVNVLHIAAAIAVGVAWGIWIHWYPLQKDVVWGLVELDVAQRYLVVGMIAVGVLLTMLMPRFSAFREMQFGLYWWEMILCFVPLFLALMFGMLQDRIPFVPLLLPLAIGAFCVWALNYQKEKVGFEPSVLGRLTFAAPNLVTYVVLAMCMVLGGTLSYGLVTDAKSPIGLLLYFFVIGFGFGWLPFACGLIFWSILRTEYPARKKK